jgi:membrane peptidoglycan carboxypeptidase
VILDIYDRDRNTVPVPPIDCKQVVTEEVADSVTALLTYVVDGPIQGRTGARMSLADRPAAGKTGTTNDSAAVWFCGFTPDLAAAVWVGDPRGGFRYPMKNLEINGTYYSQVFGGTLPGPIWKQAMTTALADSPPAQFSLASKWGLRPGRGLSSVPGADRQESSVTEEEFVFENASPDDVEEIDPSAPVEGESPAGEIGPDAPTLPEAPPSP